jgi:hypothetical protein
VKYQSNRHDFLYNSQCFLGHFKGYLGSLQLDENVRERDVRLKREASVIFWPELSP